MYLIGDLSDGINDIFHINIDKSVHHMDENTIQKEKTEQIHIGCDH